MDNHVEFEQDASMMQLRRMTQVTTATPQTPWYSSFLLRTKIIKTEKQASMVVAIIAVSVIIISILIARRGSVHHTDPTPTDILEMKLHVPGNTVSQ